VRAAFVALLLVIASGLAYSQRASSPEDDFVTDPALRAYLDETPFQHGSLHGYEDGYQAGDTDFHLQRPMPDFNKIKEYRSATRGYVDGDKEEFRTGYQDGYQLGYHDALAGRPFLAILYLQAASEHKPLMVAQSDTAPEELAVLAPPSTPIKIPMHALFPAQQAVLPPGPSAKDSALAKIMNNLRRTFMPALITPQAVVQRNPR